MLQAAIHGGMDHERARDPLLLAAAMLGSLSYLPASVGLKGLAGCLGMEGWPGPEVMDGVVRWSLWPPVRLRAPSGDLLIRPALVLLSPRQILVVETDYGETQALLGERLQRAERLAEQLAQDQGSQARGVAGLLSTHLSSPLGDHHRWSSFSRLHQRVAALARDADLSPGERRLVEDQGKLLLCLGLGGPAGLEGMQPPSPALCSREPMARWSFEAPWEGFGPLPPGPGSVLLPWHPTERV